MDKRSATVVVFLKEGRAFAGNVWEGVRYLLELCWSFRPRAQFFAF